MRTYVAIIGPAAGRARLGAFGAGWVVDAVAVVMRLAPSGCGVR
jgi:hypothetical protein